LITPTSGVNDGAYYGTVSLTSGTTYTFSVDILGVNGEPYKIWFGDTSAVLKGTATTFTAIGDWERQEVTWACDSTTTYRLYVTKNNDNNTSNFYIDGLQCEAKSYATTYCDGNQEGCKWIGAEHASTSTRDAQSRAGGKLVNFDDYGFYIDDMPGIGMPPILHQTQEQPMLPGSLLRGFKTKPRVFDLIANQIGTTHEDLHGKRKDLLNAIKPDRVLEPQPFILQYTGANSTKPIQIKAVYDSGYQFTQLDGFTEKQLPLRFIAYDDPFFYEVGDVSQALTTTSDLTIAAILAKIDSTWSNLSHTSTTSGILDMVSDGEYLYIGGNFTNWDAIDEADYIVRYSFADGTFAALGTGASGGSVGELILDANNNLYATGEFTSMGGVANTSYIAMWDGSAWNALGTGLDDAGNALAFDNSGNLYVGGDFTDAGGTTAYYIAMWDGSSWSAISGGNLNSSVDALAISSDGTIYLGGLFTTIGGSGTYKYLVSSDGSTYSTLGSGVNGPVLTLAIDNSGNLFAGGNFTTAGGDTANRIAKWNGASWTPLGTGADNTVFRLVFDNDGYLYALGAFTSMNGMTFTDRIAKWNGYTWVHMDFDLPTASQVSDVTQHNDDIYIGTYCSGTAEVSYTQIVTNNGTIKTYPELIISRSGGTSAVVQWLKNESTGATIYFDYALQDGEKITINFRPNSRNIYSSIKGNIWDAVLRGSDFGDFYLLPGDNNISIFVNEDGSPDVSAYLLWRNTHWSADGVAA